MRLRLNKDFEVEFQSESGWSTLNEELLSQLDEDTKQRYKTLKETIDKLKGAISEKEELTTWETSMYNGIITILQAGVGVAGVAIAAPFALIAGVVSEASTVIIDTLESAKIKE